MSKTNKRVTGARYEEQAVQFLTKLGYKILARNYRNRYGEIDIIALDSDNIIVYCEVKYRSSMQYGDPLSAVDYRKQEHILKTAAQHYCEYGEHFGRQCRFDVIGICGDGKITHIKSAFEG